MGEGNVIVHSGGVARREQLATLYANSGPRALRLAYLLTGDRATAEDIVQDAFVRVAGRLAHLRDPGTFDAYLRRAVVNLTKNQFRRRAVERAFLERERPNPAVDGPESIVTERRTMIEALDRLPHRQRAAIVLRFYEDLQEDRIAEILRCRPSTVRSLVFRGVQALRADLKGPVDA